VGTTCGVPVLLPKLEAKLKGAEDDVKKYKVWWFLRRFRRRLPRMRRLRRYQPK